MKVSIIVSCYNQGCYLKEALDSVINQTFVDWECIIINDGSTDNSEEISKYYMQIDKRIKYIYQENKGVCVARNNAISQSVGKYILCLDADDKISSEYVSLSVQELDKDEEVALVVSNYQYFGRSSRKVMLASYTLEKLMGHNIFVNCSMFRRNDFDRVGGFNINMNLGYEDWDLWLSLLETGRKVKYLDGIHFFYRIKKRKESRNTSVANDNLRSLREQMWNNHRNLYARVYSPAYHSIEYRMVAYSKEYRLGKILLAPIKFLYSFLLE